MCARASCLRGNFVLALFDEWHCIKCIAHLERKPRLTLCHQANEFTMKCRCRCRCRCCMCVPERCGLSTRTFRTKANIFRIYFGVCVSLSPSLSLFFVLFSTQYGIENMHYACRWMFLLWLWRMQKATKKKLTVKCPLQLLFCCCWANRSRNFAGRIDRTNMQIDWDVNMNHEWPGICGRIVFALCSALPRCTAVRLD